MNNREYDEARLGRIEKPTDGQHALREDRLDLTMSQKKFAESQQALVESNRDLSQGLQQLLKAQVLVNDQIEKAIRTVDQLGVRVDRVDGQMAALTKLYDGMIRDRGA